jgi:hypothetical protein
MPTAAEFFKRKKRLPGFGELAQGRAVPSYYARIINDLSRNPAVRAAGICPSPDAMPNMGPWRSRARRPARSRPCNSTG